MDRSLNDDQVKLVRYSIVSIRRDCEHQLPRGAGQTVVTEAMSGDDFASWMIARYLDRHPDALPPRLRAAFLPPCSDATSNREQGGWR